MGSANAKAGAIAGALAVGKGGRASADNDVDVILPDDYGSDDDVIDADQTNKGDNQANAVRSKVNQSDDDNNRRDTDSHDNNSKQNVGNTDNGKQNVGNTDNSKQNVGNTDSDDNNSKTNVGNTDNSKQNVGNTDSDDNNSKTNVGNTDNSKQNVGNTDNGKQNVGNRDDDDNDLIDFDDVDHFDIDSMLTDALNGAGNDMAFSLDQTNSLNDGDYVTSPNVSYVGGGGGDWDLDSCNPCGNDDGPGVGFHQTATAKGGTARMNDLDASGVSGGAGHDMIEAQSTTSADASLTQEAFTMNLTLGANIQYNLAETSVVGGAASDTGDGADDPMGA